MLCWADLMRMAGKGAGASACDGVDGRAMKPREWRTREAGTRVATQNDLTCDPVGPYWSPWTVRHSCSEKLRFSDVS